MGVTFAQCNTQNFTHTSNLLDNIILGWSVEGVVGVVQGPVLSVVHGPGP